MDGRLWAFSFYYYRFLIFSRHVTTRMKRVGCFEAGADDDDDDDDESQTHPSALVFVCQEWNPAAAGTHAVRHQKEIKKLRAVWGKREKARKIHLIYRLRYSIGCSAVCRSVERGLVHVIVRKQVSSPLLCRSLFSFDASSWQAANEFAVTRWKNRSPVVFYSISPWLFFLSVYSQSRSLSFSLSRHSFLMMNGFVLLLKIPSVLLHVHLPHTHALQSTHLDD